LITFTQTDPVLVIIIQLLLLDYSYLLFTLLFYSYSTVFTILDLTPFTVLPRYLLPVVVIGPVHCYIILLIYHITLPDSPTYLYSRLLTLPVRLHYICYNYIVTLPFLYGWFAPQLLDRRNDAPLDRTAPAP